MQHSESQGPEKQSKTGEVGGNEAERDFAVAEVSNFVVQVGAGVDEGQSVEYEAGRCCDTVVAALQQDENTEPARDEGDCQVDE